jgi:hypothetical protein
MAIVRGNRTDISENTVVLGTLASTTSTASAEVDALYFTFVHDVTGSVTVLDEGSLDGTNWFSLDEEKVHQQSGVDAHFYGPCYVRYIRSRVTAIGDGESVTITVACT